MKWNGKGLHIGDLTSALPIVQGGMGIGVSLSGLASAVANAGGIGVISAAGTGMNEPDYRSDFIGANIRVLKEEIRKGLHSQENTPPTSLVTNPAGEHYE